MGAPGFPEELPGHLADLRNPKLGQVDFFWQALTFEVAAIREGSRTILLDKPIYLMIAKGMAPSSAPSERC